MNVHRNNETIRQLRNVCRQKGLRLTVQKRKVLEALIDRQDHPTADQIFAFLERDLPGISRTTVYRILEGLVEMGLIRKVCHPGSAARFDPNQRRHDHLVCRQCGKLIDFEDPSLDHLDMPSQSKSSFLITEYSVYFSGLCAGCAGSKTAVEHELQAITGH